MGFSALRVLLTTRSAHLHIDLREISRRLLLVNKYLKIHRTSSGFDLLVAIKSYYHYIIIELQLDVLVLTWNTNNFTRAVLRSIINKIHL